MAITLKIISYQRLTPGQQESFQTELQRFSIGRNTDNHFSLPDPQRFMSGTHCWLEYQDGTWQLEDTSTNGVFINGSDERVAKGEPVLINQGDRVRIGDYELEVDLQAGAMAGNVTSDPFLDDEDDIFAELEVPKIDTHPPQATPDLKEVNTPLSQMDSNMLGDSVSIDDLYQLDEEEAAPEPPPSLASKSNQGSPMEQHFSAPRVAPPKPAEDVLGKYAADLDDIPDNWDDDPDSVISPEPTQPEPATLADDHETAISAPPIMPPPSAAPPAPMAAAPSVPPKQHESTPQSMQTLNADSAVAAFAAGAGLDLGLLQVADQEAFFRDLGALLKTMTQGLMQAISARGQVKSEFRLEQTMIAPTENNPFKFSVSAEEAMLRLINRKDGAYLSGIAAAAEAVDDINAHQMAVMAGTEAALKSILHRFNPTKLESKFSNDSAMSKALPMLKKARYWEFYKVLYSETSEAVDDDFQQLFGTEFSNAYEQQLDRLKISRKESSK